MLHLSLLILALTLSAAALVFAYVSWRRAPLPTLANHGARIADLESSVMLMSERQTKRHRAENMEEARDAHKARRQAQDKILAEASAILEASGPGARPGGQGELALPADRAQAKETLRKIAGLH